MKRFLHGGIPLLWMGMVLAISFMEAPLKFQAPGITVELGLGIGRIVFSTLNIIELVLAVLLGFSYLGRISRVSLGFYIATSLILLAETFWLLPILDERAVQLLQGTPPPPASYHMVYIILDAVKVVSLGIIGYMNIKFISNNNI